MNPRSILVVALALVLAASLTACGGSKTPGAGVVTVGGVPRLSSAAEQVSSASIRAARRSSLNFKIFPRRVATRACRIPAGGAGPGQFFGTCTTQFVHLSPPGADQLVEIAFTERWHGGITVAGSEIWWHTTWNIFVAHGRVLNSLTQTFGATPPQSWI